jgi:hypothetical protein
MGSKILIKSPNVRSLPGVLALIFLLTIILPVVAIPQESQTCQQDVLRQASLKWMQVGTQQYHSNRFQDAEQSFRRALVFRKYLTDAECNRLNELLANARIAATEGIQAVAITQNDDESVERDQQVKDDANEENTKVEQLSMEAGRRQIKKVIDKMSSQPNQQKVPSIVMAEHSAPKIQLAAESSGDIVLVNDESFRDKYMQLSDWLVENRRNILIIGLPVLAVLVIIAKLQGRKRRPGTRVYQNHALASNSIIGARLNDGGHSKRKFRALKTRRPAPAAAANSNRKSFTQSTEHWRKDAVQSPPAGKPFETNESRPQRKDKFQNGDSAVTEAERKQCSKCKQLKPLSDFYKNRSTKDGLARWCKQCKKEYHKNRQSAKK